jgi:hypothetical protein
VVPRGHNINAAAEQLVGNVGRNPEPGCLVFPVGNHHVNSLGRADVCKMIGDNSAAGMAKDIANEE